MIHWKHMPHPPVYPGLIALAIALAARGSDRESARESEPALEREAIPAGAEQVPHDAEIDPADFVASIDHPFMPWRVGSAWVFAGEGDEGAERVEVEVLSETREVLGVECTVVRDVVYIEGELIEDTQDWYAQDRDGNVWYFGEDVRDYENGELVGSGGAWEAGVDGAVPGIVMPADPQPGDPYYQEYHAGEAEDQAKNLRRDGKLELDFGSYENVLVVEEWTDLEPEVTEHKHYVADIGMVKAEVVRGGDGFIELIDYRKGDELGSMGGAAAAAGELAWAESSFYIELTEDDIEVQSFVDGSRWKGYAIEGPGGDSIFRTVGAGFMGRQGLSELQVDGWPSHFPIVGDPDHLEIESVDVYLDRFPVDMYRFRGETVDGDVLSGTAEFTHDLPDLPEIMVPEDADEPVVLAPEAVVIEWEPVTRTYSGSERIDIVEYEVIVEQVEPFRKLSVHLPASATSLTVPREFRAADALYDVEVVAIERSDNQSISVSEFRTSESAEAATELAKLEDAWGVTQLFIELSEDDIELQSFVDGSRWDRLQIFEPGGAVVFGTEADSFMGLQGLSELKVDGWPSHFPIAGDPEHLEIASVDDFLAIFPAGTYRFQGEKVDGGLLLGEAELSHDLPALPEILAPGESDKPVVLDPNDLVIRWEPVTETFSGSGRIDVVEYEVIVEQIEPFRKLSIHLPASATSLTVPSEFLVPDALYDVEIMAIEASDNQSFAVAEFKTAPR